MNVVIWRQPSPATPPVCHRPRDELLATVDSSCAVKRRPTRWRAPVLRPLAVASAGTQRVTWGRGWAGRSIFRTMRHVGLSGAFRGVDCTRSLWRMLAGHVPARLTKRESTLMSFALRFAFSASSIVAAFWCAAAACCWSWSTQAHPRPMKRASGRPPRRADTALPDKRSLQSSRSILRGIGSSGSNRAGH